jgi:hypothetical protein
MTNDKKRLAGDLPIDGAPHLICRLSFVMRFEEAPEFV